ncbi:MAG TPA: tail fiber domain-containing protein, partial [Chitinophagaceae bacterium]|nr:tail fiber domain-containing protein [Chitinophagaceae bacterium]
GAGAGQASPASNMVQIGNTSVTWIGGQVPWSTYSDERIKKDIRNDVPGLDFINRLRPVSYTINSRGEEDIIFAGISKKTVDSFQHNWASKYDIEKMRMTGFLAQEVEKAAKDAGYDFSGVHAPKNANGLYSLNYSDFVMPLVKSVQELNERVVKLEKENNELKTGKASPDAVILQLQQTVNELKIQLDALKKKQ